MRFIQNAEDLWSLHYRFSLLSELKAKQAEDLGYQRLALSVGKKNQAAISLYEKMGFEISHLNMFRQLTPPEHTSSSKS